MTLTGLGGVGKTRLALRVASESTRAFPGGVWFVDFSELQEPALLDQTILTALGVQDRSTRSPRSVLIDRLVNDRILLVLDNCEHLIEWVADTVAELLRHCARLALLATSREPLDIQGEAVLRVPPMKLPTNASLPTDDSNGDAMALFEQRAQSTVTDFRITNENSAVVEKIVRQLEGLPLPIELAAARLKAMSVDQILQRLNDRFQLLTQGSRNAPERQQTLAQSIDWSFDLCTPPEQFLWAHLSVFAGSFDLESVEGIFSEEFENEDLDDLVMSLVDKSILIREQDGPYVRYRILETLREYGRGLVPDDEWDSLQHRHCNWFRQLIFCAEKDWIGPHQIDWMARIDCDLPNVRSALEFSLTDLDSIEDTLHAASALHDYWLTRGRFNEGRYWLDRALTAVPARIEGTLGDAVVEATVTGALLAALQRDIASATNLTEKARLQAEIQRNDDGRVLATYALGFVAVADGDLARGAEYLDQAIEAFQANDNITRLVPALYWFAFVVDALGETDRAAGIYEQELTISESQGEIVWRSMTMSDYGSALWRHGDHTRGIELLEDSLRLMQGLGNQFGCAWCLEELAWTLVDGDAKLAATLMGAADTLFAATGSPMATFGSMVAYHEAGALDARNKIGDKDFQQAFDHGKVLTLDDAIAHALREQPLSRSPKTTTDDSILTPRELQVAELVAQGLTNKAIAEKLVISQRTVDGHVDHIRNKLGYGSRTRIATWVLQRKNSLPNSSGS
ncbi:LuxR C-terminal-related transcriptional regulator [Rhodococcus sp. KBS0724]|uniref:LuxR C-terminal-related transcriptional regulator n=1 Tax=Rhodococcus sp. KBS0724 TaxID=1179674 RepID=UPI0021B0A2EF|nr:LuxR C-terminal-related transcriptional regulator [Rhodococcus sp. KBS0724]